MSVAGHETSTVLLKWVIYEISKNTQLQNKAREEIKSKLGDSKPSYDSYDQLTYVNALILEGLRVHPPVTSVVKQVCKKETTLCDITITKGTQIDIFIAGAHYDDRHWENPEQFNPERFITEQNELRSESSFGFSFVPFSAGLRKCIGFRFSLLESCMILTRLIQCFKFESMNTQDDPVGEFIGITVGPDNLKVKIIPIEQQ